MEQSRNKVKMFRSIVNEMADLYEKKNQNYGDSFGKNYKRFGKVAGLTPIFNKTDRLESLIANGNENNFESLEDTFKDLACYCIMNLIELKLIQNEEELSNYQTKDNINTVINNETIQELIKDYNKMTIGRDVSDMKYTVNQQIDLKENDWSSSVKKYPWGE